MPLIQVWLDRSSYREAALTGKQASVDFRLITLADIETITHSPLLQT
jgi:hypothetical protein